MPRLYIGGHDLRTQAKLVRDPAVCSAVLKHPPEWAGRPDAHLAAQPIPPNILFSCAVPDPLRGVFTRSGRYNRGMGTGAAAKIGLDVRLTYYTGGGIARYIRHLASDLPAWILRWRSRISTGAARRRRTPPRPGASTAGPP